MPLGGPPDARQRTTRAVLVISIERQVAYGYGLGDARLGLARGSALDSLSNSNGARAAADSASASNASAGAPPSSVLHMLIALTLCLLLMVLVGFVLVLVIRRRAELRAMRSKQDAQAAKSAAAAGSLRRGEPTSDLLEERTLEVRVAQQLSAEKRSLLEGAPPASEAANTVEVRVPLLFCIPHLSPEPEKAPLSTLTLFISSYTYCTVHTVLYP